MGSDEDRIKRLPCWNGAVDISPLHGGLSNANYLVSDSRGRHVVRFGVDYPFHHVSRPREVMMARAAHDAGFAPRVEYADNGVMVTEFLDAKTFAAEDVRKNPERVARLLKDFHGEMARRVTGPGFMFWAFHVNRDYVLTLREKNCRHLQLLQEMSQVNDALERVQVALPIVLGHHDLLPANFLDDGKKLWLIDFEYAGFGTAMFDLAGAASNSQMTAEQSRALVEAYLGDTPNSAFRQSFAAMQCAALLRETLWAMTSEIFLKAPGVDYGAYVADTLALYHTAIDTYQSVHGLLT